MIAMFGERGMFLIGHTHHRFRRTPFDVAHAFERVLASDWTLRDEFVAENLLAAPDRDEAIAVLEARR